MYLTNQQYEIIKKKVVELFQFLNIHRIPIDCFEICRRMGIQLVPYSSLSGKKLQAIKKFSQDGVSLLWEENGKSGWKIFYNDAMPSQRIRFTIMHEIGHIVLDHTEHSELAESEANFFARYALAPSPLVGQLEIEDYVELSTTFDLSLQCASYAMRAYLKWLKHSSADLLDYEVNLLSLFQFKGGCV